MDESVDPRSRPRLADRSNAALPRTQAEVVSHSRQHVMEGPTRMSQEPKYLSQGINFLGFLSRQLGDLTGKSALAHELIQNADDAKDESGRLSATRATFDITDDALIVSNDAVFREIDFSRIRDVAGGSKRDESGDRTTGAFGIGFIAVYQVTDRPEIHSAGRVWRLSPDKPEDQRIQEWFDSQSPKTREPCSVSLGPLRNPLFGRN